MEVVDVVGGLAVDVALADPPAGVLVAGPHLAPAPRPALPVAHVAVVVPRARTRPANELQRGSGVLCPRALTCQASPRTHSLPHSPSIGSGSGGARSPRPSTPDADAGARSFPAGLPPPPQRPASSSSPSSPTSSSTPRCPNPYRPSEPSPRSSPLLYPALAVPQRAVPTPSSCSTTPPHASWPPSVRPRSSAIPLRLYPLPWPAPSSAPAGAGDQSGCACPVAMVASPPCTARRHPRPA